MNEAQLDDLKQYLDSRLSQTEARLVSKIQQSVDGLRTELVEKIDLHRSETVDGFAHVVETLGHQADEDKADTDIRLDALEASGSLRAHAS